MIPKTIKEYSEIYRCPATNENEYCRHDIISAINFGVKLQQERSYSEEEVIQLVSDWNDYRMSEDTKSKVTFKKWFEQFKKTNGKASN